MKRLLLGSLMSCMLVGQVLAMEEDEVASDWNAKASQVWDSVKSPLGVFAKGFAKGSILTTAGVAAATVVVCSGKILMDLEPVRNHPYSKKFQTSIGSLYRSPSGLTSICKNFFRLGKDLMKYDGTGVAAIVSGLAVGVGGNLLAAGNTLLNVLDEPSISASQGIHALGRAVGSVATVC